MTDRKYLAAFTPASGYHYYPPYINISKAAGTITVTVRHEESTDDNGTSAGTTSSITMSEADFIALLGEIERNAK